MKIELKKVKICSWQSQETTSFAADIFIDGKKAGYAHNEGMGGATHYGSYEGYQQLISDAELFCKALPPSVYNEYQPPLVVPMDLEHFIDTLVDAEITKKEQAKFEKKFTNHLMWGFKGATSYTQVKFKVALSQIPLDILQKQIDKYKAQFKDGEAFLNNNLTALGIKL